MIPSPSTIAVEWSECLVPAVPQPLELKREVAAHMGVVPGWLSRLAPVPWLVRACARVMSHPVAHIELELCELIGLVVSRDNSCRYCFGVQRALFKILGYREELIAALERDFHTAAIPPKSRAALEFARRISRADPRPTAADRAELDALGFAPVAIAEIAFTAGEAVFANRIATLLALPPESLETDVERPLFRLIRPWIAFRMRSRPRLSATTVTANDGPYANVVTALAGSPAAEVLRTVIDDAWASTILPARSKALMAAVVARALGCASGEAEARAMLTRGGFGETDTDDVLRHLGSPRLDAREALLVPLARDSVRYQTAVIQGRMQEISAGFTPEEILEIAGMLALVNAICRLTILLDAC